MFLTEREIGVPLLVRGRQKTRLTLQGEVFLAEAKKVLAAADHAVATVRRSARGEIGTPNIGFFNGGTGSDVPAIIKDFRRLHPGAHVLFWTWCPARNPMRSLMGPSM